ncbi:MAG TPA: T9SS type A sorting domain-containing protein, partial [Chitinophagaceae bacterium]|nr:T9SS type A sorting domain-containing protein [Chitinophagaceae bacterium]
KTAIARFYISDAGGKMIQTFSEKIQPGNNILVHDRASSLPNGVYYLRIILDDEMIIRKFNVVR